MCSSLFLAIFGLCFPVLSPQLMETNGSAWGPLSVLWPRNSLKLVRWRNQSAHFICFLSLGITYFVTDVQCLLNNFFSIFCLVFICSLCEHKLGPCYFIFTVFFFSTYIFSSEKQVIYFNSTFLNQTD